MILIDILILIVNKYHQINYFYNPNDNREIRETRFIYWFYLLSVVFLDYEIKKIYRMNVKQAKILLEKINRLFQSMTMDEHISEIEKELMRNYVKSLYEEFLPDNAASTAPIAPPPPRVVQEKPKVVTPPRVERIVETPPPPPPPPPKVEVVPEPVATPKPVVTKAPKVIEAQKVVKPRVVRTPPPPPPPRVKKSKIRAEYEELFEFKEAKELSERLSQQPLKDLRKAMGINERILTTNELFDGNSDALNETLSTLNGLSDFDEAKDYLANIADIYDWSTKKKKKKAKIFVKLVRRKFL